MKARTTGSTILATATAALLILSTPALAAGGGGGGGAGRGGGGTGGGSAGGGGGASTTGSIYADLVIALRDVDGTPTLKKYEVPATSETDATTEYCVQPVSYEKVPGVTSSTNPVDGREVWVLPLQGEWILDPPDPLPVEEIEACDPWPQYAMFVSEVEMERLNLARTADEVIARKLADVALKLEFAEAISLQSTGRITYDGSTIDASPENAAMYQSLMKTGTDTWAPRRYGRAAGSGRTGTCRRGLEQQVRCLGAGGDDHRCGGEQEHALHHRHRRVLQPDHRLPDRMTYDRSGRLADRVHPRPRTRIRAQEMATGERFVDYSGFSYNRSETFKGSITWLDVPTLKWQVTKIIDTVPFTNLSSEDPLGTEHAHGHHGLRAAGRRRAGPVQLHPGQHIPPRVLHGPPGRSTPPQRRRRRSTIRRSTSAYFPRTSSRRIPSRSQRPC